MENWVHDDGEGWDQSTAVTGSCLLLLFTKTATTFDNSCKFKTQDEKMFSMWNVSQSRNGWVDNLLHISTRVVTRRLGGIPEHGQHLFHLILLSENQSEAKQWVGRSGLGFAD